MLTNEEIENESNELTKVLLNEGVETDLVYSLKESFTFVDKENRQIEVNAITARLAKQPFAIYPMICVTLANATYGNEVGYVYFQSQNKAGFKLQDYDLKIINGDEVFFDIENLHNFLKDLKLGAINFELYESEKARLEESLASINKILEKKGK